MNHPTREEMMEHLYGENSQTPQRGAVDAHLRACPECRTQVTAWRKTMHALDAWRLPAPAARPSWRAFVPVLRWTAAAAILISAGFLAGRTISPDSGALRAALLDTVKQEVATQVVSAMDRERATLATELRAAARDSASEETRQQLASFATQIDERRQADAEVYSNAFQQLNERHAEAVSLLRKDLSTVAVVADARLLKAQEQIFELASVQSGSLR